MQEEVGKSPRLIRVISIEVFCYQRCIVKKFIAIALFELHYNGVSDYGISALMAVN